MLASSSGRGPAQLSNDSPWWKGLEGGGSEGSNLNKLAVPDLEVIPPFVLHFSCHRGDGRRVGEGWSFGLDRLGRCSSPSAFMGELRRLIWLPVFDAPPTALLAEGRPSSSSRLGSQRGGSATPTRNPCYLSNIADGGGAMEVASYQVVRPRRRCDYFCVDVAFGPDCNLVSLLGVLLTRFRDLSVIFLFFESFCELCNVTAYY